MKILIVCFSRGGTVEKIVEGIRTHLNGAAQLTVARIKPTRDRSYWGWLLRSFIPHYRVSIRSTVTDIAPYDLICLGFPKWTYACPPVNQYLREMEHSEGKHFALFMCHRGFDQERYLRGMLRQVTEKGGRVVATLTANQKTVEDGSYLGSLTGFCDRINSYFKEFEEV